MCSPIQHSVHVDFSYQQYNYYNSHVQYMYTNSKSSHTVFTVVSVVHILGPKAIVCNSSRPLTPH